MQPAVAEVVQNFTLPDSTAIAGALRSARRSFPSCAPPARGAPKSSLYVTSPITGNTSRGTDFACEAFAPATSASMTMTTATIRIVRGPTSGPCPRSPPLESARMKIAVCVKQVPEAQSKRIDPGTKRLDRSGEAALNAFDANAIEEALRVKESSGGGEVVLVSLGPQSALDALRKGLAMGAGRAVLVSDAAAAGSDLVATSLALAKALEREGADLILFGQQASDSDGAVLWAAVADRLRVPVVSQAAELMVADGKARVKRQTEFGYDTIEAPLPAVVAVSDAINEPRYPSLKGIMGAKKKPQETLSVADLGVDASQLGEAGSKTEVLSIGDPPARGDTVKIEDDGSGAQKIADFLAEKRLL